MTRRGPCRSTAPAAMSSKLSQEKLVAGAACAVAALAALAYRRLCRKVAALEAKDQMREFAAYYTRGVDRLDPKMILAAFEPDATMDIPNLPQPVPVSEFAVGATDFLKKTLVATQHCVSNAIVVLAPDGKTARSEIYFIAHHWKLVDGEIRNAGVNGRYLDTWTRGDDGVYRICKRKLLYDFQGTLWNDAVKAAADTPDDLVQAPSVARPENLGRRDKDDYSYIHLHGL